MNTKSITGGAANISGIHYQILRSLLQAVRVVRIRSKAEGSVLTECQIVLEPRDGGDLRVATPDGLVVEQMKTKSSGTWSLADVIHKVLPDLFKAFQGDGWKRIAKVRFVTSGRRGRWSDFRTFLALDGVTASSDPESHLDEEIPVQGITSYLSRRLEENGFSPTRFGLTLYIAKILESGHPSKNHLCRVVRMLSLFEFEQTVEEELAAEIERHLLPRVLKVENLPATIHRLIGELLERSRTSEPLDARELLERHGLSGDLSDREMLVSRSHQKVAQQLSREGYDRHLDVRGTQPLEAAGSKPVDEDPIEPRDHNNTLCIVGESGTGKSWLLSALALNRSAHGCVVVKVDADSSYEGTLNRASTYFCNEIWDHDGVIPLPRIERRIKKITRTDSLDWFEMIIDGVQSAKLAEKLVTHWSGPGRLTLALTSGADELPTSLLRNSQVVRTGQFTTPELRNYLSRRLPDEDLRVPYSREGRGSLIYRPLFARLYCDIAEREGLPIPTSEYELLEGFCRNHADQMPLPVSCLASLSAEPPSGRAYPWSPSTLAAAGLKQEELLSLVQKGLLRRATDRRGFLVVHDRVLEWLIAEGWNQSLRDSERSVDEIVEQATEMQEPNRQACWGKLWLGGATTDLLWLLMDPDKQPMTSKALTLVEELPRFGLLALGSIGARAVPLLSQIVKTRPTRSHEAVEALVNIGTQEVRQLALVLLKEADRDFRLVGAEIAKYLPVPEGLDHIWKLRLEMNRDEQPHLVKIYNIVDEALRTSVKEADKWLEDKIKSADSKQASFSSLIYLLTGLTKGREVWLRNKDYIIENISESEERCIATCMEAFRDDDDLEWLQQRARERDDYTGAAARRALAVLAPERPIDPLVGDGHMLVFARGWWLLPQINLNLERVEDFIASTLESEEDPWQLACSLLAGFENYLTPETLDGLLDQLPSLIREDMESIDCHAVRGPFRFLSRIGRLELLRRIENRAGKELEESLIIWLEEEGPNNTGSHDQQLAEAVSVLLKINGRGIGAVADSWLPRAEQWWAAEDALDLAVVTRTSVTPRLIRDIVFREEIGDGQAVARRDAIGALLSSDELDLAIEALRHWAHEISQDVANLLMAAPIPKSALDPIQQLAAGETQRLSANDLFLLAALGNTEDLDVVHEHLRGLPKGSSSARLILSGLDLSRRNSPEALQAFLDHLEFEETRFACVLGLLRIGSEPAVEALMELLPSQEGLAEPNRHTDLIAVNLLSMDLGAADEVALRLWNSLAKYRISLLTAGAVGPFLSLGLPEIRQWVEDIAFADPGTGPEDQAAFIRALAAEDPEEAFDAARRLLEIRGSDEPATPDLLLLSDPERAQEILRSKLATESSYYFLAIIGECLVHHGASQTAVDWLSDQDPKIREAACVVAEVMPWTSDLDHALRQCIRDEVWEVRNAANSSLGKLWLARQTDRLVDEILHEQSSSRKWSLLDTVLALGHPGLWYQPPWLEKLLDGLDLPYRQRARKRLKKRRSDIEREYNRLER